jgi:hypothetical protein
MMRLALRNRPDHERRVLLLLRGASPDFVLRSRLRKNEAAPKAEHMRCFAHLRRVAVDYGLVIQSPDLSYVHADELRLLSWLPKRSAWPVPARLPPSRICVPRSCVAPDCSMA